MPTWRSTAPATNPQRSPAAKAAAASTPMTSEASVTWFGVRPRRAAQRAMKREYGETKNVVKKPSAPLTAESSSRRSSSSSAMRASVRPAAAGDSGRDQKSSRR